MPLSLPPLNFAIICDGYEMETYDAKLDGPNSIRAYVASEAGKQFRIVFSNNLFDHDLALALYIDGERVYRSYLRARQRGQIIGIPKTTSSVLPFKFQELQVVDPDVENAPVVPEMGTIELRAFRCQAQRTVQYLYNTTNGLHQGRVSERSKKAGWHHVSTADEVPANVPTFSVYADLFDPKDVPFASVKIFYRPRELLMAEGVITRYGVGARIGGGSEANERKRAREDYPPGPSTKRRTGSTVKKEEMSVNARAQRIQALRAELNSLTAEQSGSSSSVKREFKSPCPMVVDLTLDD